MKARGHRQALVTAALALVALWLTGCSTDSPTAPQQQPPPTGGPPSAVWNITVTASPTELPAGSDQSSTITVDIRRASDGQRPPNDTTAVLSTTLGEFGNQGSGQQSGTITLVNGRAQVAFFPGDIGGTAVIQARLEESVGQAQVSILGIATFVVQSIEPSAGSPLGGDVVAILGTGFDRPVRVTFGGMVAQVVSFEPTRIEVRTPAAPQAVPAGTTLPVTVTVTINFNEPDQASDSLPSGFTYAPGGSTDQPVILSVSPASGPNEGGTEVVINGDGFQRPVQVFFGQGTSPNGFNGVEAQVVSVTRTQIVVISPSATGFGQSNLNQNVNILVLNGNGLFSVVQAAFQYGVKVLITAISPSAGPYFGGQLVTVFGQGFDAPVAVEMGGVGQQIISVTGTEIVIRTVAIIPDACNDQAGATEVVNIESGDGAEGGPVYTYRVKSLGPFISFVSPSTGAQAGGDDVTLTGNNLVEPLTVTFTIGGQSYSASIVSVGPEQIVVRTPAVPNSVLDTETCNDDGDEQDGERYLATAAGITVTNLTTTCEVTLENAFTYQPTDGTCRNDAAPPEPPPPPPDPPSAAFTWSIVSGNLVQFTDQSGGNPTGWAWDVDNDGTFDSFVQNPLLDLGTISSLPIPGNIPVRLRATNAGGSDETVNIVVIPP